MNPKETMSDKYYTPEQKAIRVMELKAKYRHLYTNLVAGKKESGPDWARRMLVECGHDPADCITIPLDQLGIK